VTALITLLGVVLFGVGYLLLARPGPAQTLAPFSTIFGGSVACGGIVVLYFSGNRWR